MITVCFHGLKTMNGVVDLLMKVDIARFGRLLFTLLTNERKDV